MSKRLCKIFISIALVLSSFGFYAKAEGGAPMSFTPYSIYGVGDLTSPGTAYNRTMAGVGIAGRTHRFINPINPASVSARDSLSFMLDFSAFGSSKIFYQGASKAVSHVANVGDFIISFPIYRSLAMMVGIMPYSATGFSYSIDETDPQKIAALGNINYAATGLGGNYQLFAGLGVTPVKGLSIGGEFIYYFGSTVIGANLTYGKDKIPDISSTSQRIIRGYTGKFGLQYEFKIGKKNTFCLGATYKMQTPLQGNLQQIMVSTKLDTIDTYPQNVHFAGEMGVGLSWKFSDKLTFEFDYTRSDWRDCGIDESECFAIKEVQTPFQASVAQSFRFGMEYVPNRSDVRYYYKKIAYRAGLYYSTDYYTVGGHPISSKGITIGVTLPVFRWYNGITIGFDFGQRGTLENNLIKENYCNFAVALNLFDIWFQKYRYD